MADVGDVCPASGTWIPTPLSSDTGISNAGTESINSSGQVVGCHGGGTGWHATKGGANVVVSNWHVLLGSGHAVAPDIYTRNCQLFKEVDLPSWKCGPSLPVDCDGWSANQFTTELGMIQGGVRPLNPPAINLDDASYSKGQINGQTAAGNMISTLTNIGPVGIPIPISAVVFNLGVQYNGNTSCHQHGLVTVPNFPTICTTNGPCYNNLIQVAIAVDNGDSGALGVTDVGSVGNNPFGMLVAKSATSTSSFGYFIPIGQVIKDLGLDVVAGSGTGTGGSPSPGSVVSGPDDAIRAAVGHNAWMAKLKHVTGVTYGGGIHGELAIIVFVDKAANIGEVSRKVPSRIEGFPVDVEEVPTAELL